MRIALLATVLCIGAAPVVSHSQSAEPMPTTPAAETAPAAEPGPVAHPTPLVQPAKIRDSNNALFVELLGSAGLYSINYERIIGDFSARLGFSYLGFLPGSHLFSPPSFIIPLTFSYLGIHGSSHHLDVGFGPVLVAIENSWNTGVFGTAIIGYRYAPLQGGFMFRVAFTPLFGINNGTVGFQPWGGLALGYVF